MIGSPHRNQVHILAQEGNRIVCSEPEYDPIGIGVEGLLKSELYRLRSTLAPEVLAKLDRHYKLRCGHEALFLPDFLEKAVADHICDAAIGQQLLLAISPRLQRGFVEHSLGRLEGVL